MLDNVIYVTFNCVFLRIYQIAYVNIYLNYNRYVPQYHINHNLTIIDGKYHYGALFAIEMWLNWSLVLDGTKFHTFITVTS